jgi:N-acetylmuramoyl-L-alanine amidase
MYEQPWTLAARLMALGYEVMVARRGMSLEEAKDESNAWGADIHICLHSNASVKHNAFGCEAFYCPGSVVGERLALAVYARLSALNPRHGRRCAPTGFYELRKTNAWASYLELGFHDRPDEAAWIVRDRDRIAEAIAEAIVVTPV